MTVFLEALGALSAAMMVVLLAATIVTVLGER